MRKKPLLRWEMTEQSPQYDYELRLLLDFIGSLLRNERYRRGLTQQDLAYYCALPQSYLSDLENGKKDFQISTLLRIAIVFGTHLNHWMPDEEKLRLASFQTGGWGVDRKGPGLLTKKSRVYLR